MLSPQAREASVACFRGCCSAPPFCEHTEPSTTQPTSSSLARFEFEHSMATTLLHQYNSHFTNPESIPSSPHSFSTFMSVFPLYSHTAEFDRLRERDYPHLSVSNRVYLDYTGHGLFSYHQLQQQSNNRPDSDITSDSSFFSIRHKPTSLCYEMQRHGEELELESTMRRRIMAYMNISEDDYNLVFTANQSSAFKVLADSYPFQSNRNLLTVYDYEDEAVEAMISVAKARGARAMSAEFVCPGMRIMSAKLMAKVVARTKKRRRERGLFVFPLQSRVTGARYSYLWMSLAKENGWHVLLDATALGPKYMETLGLSIFKPDFLVCSFYEVFGENPSGFCCLFVKKSSASDLEDLVSNTSIGIVRLVPCAKSEELESDDSATLQELKPDGPLISLRGTATQQPKPDYAATSYSGRVIGQELHPEPSFSRVMTSRCNEIKETTEYGDSRIEESETEHNQILLEPKPENPGASTSGVRIQGCTEIQEIRECGDSRIECRGLDNADSLGLVLISSRARYLMNWVVNAMMSLRHPHGENGIPLTEIYGPRIKFDRGHALAFNVFDWKSEKVDPFIVQKLADRYNISLSTGVLKHIVWAPQKYAKDTSSSEDKIRVVVVSVSLLTNFEDVHRLWSFVSKFLDADFLEKERWRYMSLNQKMVEV